MDYSLKRNRADAYTKEEVLEELKRVAAEFSGATFSTRDFERKTKSCSYQAVFRVFGTWEKALAAVGVVYKRKRGAVPNKIPDVDLFAEMERVWKELGHRPSKQEWDKLKTKYSYQAYHRRFGGWVPACGKFIEYKSGQYSPDPIASPKAATATTAAPREAERETRQVPLKLRFRIMNRDGYRCVLCGKSPATDVGTVLHIDHIVPYSKGGKASSENLRTICQNCNWGKGSD